MRNSWWVLGVVVSLCVGVGVVNGQVAVTIVGAGASAYPIALSPLKALSPAGSSAGVDFVDIVARDLPITGMFKVVPADTYIEPAEPVTDDSINFDNWSVLGALALAKGTVTQDGDQLVIEVRLFDVLQRRQLMGRRYRGRLADVRRMANKFADDVVAQFTGRKGPFNSRLVFLSNRDGGRLKQLYTMSLDGGDLNRVTNVPSLNLAPSWRPGAGAVLLTSYRLGNADLFSVDLAGGNWAKLSSVPGLNLGGRWSPDGTRIALARESAGNSDIFVLNADGSLRRRLTDHPGIDVSPAWSPDSGSIAFCSDRGGAPQIYVIDANGGGPRRVTFEGSYNTSPAWSPAGDRIAYASRVGGRFQVFTVKVDGTDVRQITRSAGDNEDPSWAPDGRYLIFSSTRGGRRHLYVSDAAGLSQFELTRENADDSSPNWSGWLD